MVISNLREYFPNLEIGNYENLEISLFSNGKIQENLSLLKYQFTGKELTLFLERLNQLVEGTNLHVIKIQMSSNAYKFFASNRELSLFDESELYFFEK